MAALSLAPAPAAAQDATLTARDGSLAISGDLLGWDGEVFRIATAWGPLTVDAAGVICTGPACPELTAPLARLRVTGAADPGLAVLPALWTAFAAARGLAIEPVPADPGTWAARLTDPARDQTLAEIAFAPSDPETARAQVAAGQAEAALLPEVPQGTAFRTLGGDALVPLAAAANRLPRLSTADLAAALRGEATNWQAFGGPDMPVALHALDPATATGGAVVVRLGHPLPDGTLLHPDPDALAAAVARDPWALALAPRLRAGAARVMPLTDSCGFPLEAGPVAVKAGDYPLTLDWHLVTPRRRLPLILREFLEFLPTDAAQAAVAAAGLVDRRPSRAPLAADGRRLLGAIRNAGAEVPLAELQRLAAAMDGGERLSLTLRFEDGSSRLDAASETGLADLGRLIAVRGLDGWQVVLAGFSDGSGAAATNLALSRDRALAARAALARLAPDLAPEDLPQVEAWGEALPMACDTTATGRRINRRVEVWLRPLPDWDGPRPEPGAAVEAAAAP